MTEEDMRLWLDVMDGKEPVSHSLTFCYGDDAGRLHFANAQL